VTFCRYHARPRRRGSRAHRVSADDEIVTANLPRSGPCPSRRPVQAVLPAAQQQKATKAQGRNATIRHGIGGLGSVLLKATAASFRDDVHTHDRDQSREKNNLMSISNLIYISYLVADDTYMSCIHFRAREFGLR
jgi:hypothetical protein